MKKSLFLAATYLTAGLSAFATMIAPNGTGIPANNDETFLG